MTKLKKTTHEVGNIEVQLGIPTSQPKFSLKKGVAENTCVSQSQMKNLKKNQIPEASFQTVSLMFCFVFFFFYHPCVLSLCLV